MLRFFISFLTFSIINHLKFAKIIVITLLNIESLKETLSLHFRITKFQEIINQGSNKSVKINSEHSKL